MLDDLKRSRVGKCCCCFTSFVPQSTKGVGAGCRSTNPTSPFASAVFVSRFDLARRARITLLCALLNMLAVEKEVVPVHGPALKNRHSLSSLGLFGLVQLVVISCTIPATFLILRVGTVKLFLAIIGTESLVRKTRIEPRLHCEHRFSEDRRPSDAIFASARTRANSIIGC